MPSSMNKNKIVTDDWSDARSRTMFQRNWPDDEICRKLHDAGDQCGACSFFAPFNSDWGLCCNEKSRHSMETVFNQFTCPTYFREGRGPHSFTEITEVHCHCGGRSSSSQKSIELESDGNRYRLTRLRDGEYYELRQNSIHIAEDLFFLFTLKYSRKQTCDHLNLPKLYLVLRSMFGDSGRYYDERNGSFAFPFSLEVSKGNKKFAYALEIYNHTESITFRIRRRIDPDDKRYDGPARHNSYPPFEDEFSRSEINQFIATLYDHLVSQLRVIEAKPIESFFRTVPECFIVYGYLNDRFFELQLNEEEFHHMVEALEASKIPREPNRNLAE